ncbi:MAG TPA: hypothetical protein VK890_02390 [Bacteroidia bacterium]|jgi:hypothetical protein|nr:hypothetical protein [Bacteroidia bacterium]HWY98926.1 hypothetical protein [Bacteroidia bacterium]
MIKTNSSRAVEAAAAYIDSLYQQGKNLVLLHTFSGEQCLGTICQQEVERYNPLRVIITLVSDGTDEQQSFDLSDVVSIQPV